MFLSRSVTARRQQSGAGGRKRGEEEEKGGGGRRGRVHWGTPHGQHPCGRRPLMKVGNEQRSCEMRKVERHLASGSLPVSGECVCVCVCVTVFRGWCSDTTRTPSRTRCKQHMECVCVGTQEGKRTNAQFFKKVTRTTK